MTQIKNSKSRKDGESLSISKTADKLVSKTVLEEDISVHVLTTGLLITDPGLAQRYGLPQAAV
jgi:hypothetical protein